MTRSYHTTREWIAEARKQERLLEDQLNQVAARMKKHERGAEELQQREEVARGELLRAIFPTLSQEAVTQAAEWSGYYGLHTENPLEKRAQVERTLRQRIAEIEVEPAYRDREELRDPDVGSLTRKLSEARDHQRPLASVVRKAHHPRLRHLLAVGYGTPDYAVGFWRLSYYSDWKAGDEILESFPDYEEEFGRFRNYYVEIKKSYDTLTARVDELQAEWDRGVALETELATCHESLTGLDEHILEESRKRLEAFLVDSGPEVFGERLAQVPQVELMAKRWVSLTQQIHYLKQVYQYQLVSYEQRLSAELSKFRRKMVKYRRPKKARTRFSQQEFARTFKDRTPKYAKHWKNYDRGYHNLTSFDHYHLVTFDDDVLWWDLYHDGRLSGSYIPEVQRWRDRHDAYRYRRWKERERELRQQGWHDPREAEAAAAVAQADQVDDQDDGFYDAS